MSTAVTDNPLVQKQKEAINGRGKYPARGATEPMHKSHKDWDVLTRAQEMKGFKGDNYKGFKP